MRRAASRSIIGAAALLLALAPIGAGAAPDAPGVRFRFSFGALTGTGATQKLAAITQDTGLKTGDRIKLMIEVLQPGFIYLVHRGPDGEIDLLFPSDLKQNAQTLGKHYVPGGTGWLALDNQMGDETFYLVGSKERQRDLETLLAKYTVSQGTDKARAATDIVAEIRQLRAAHRNVAAEAEKPVIIGGNVRALGRAGAPAPLPDISTLAREITSTDYYGKTFTITHK